MSLSTLPFRYLLHLHLACGIFEATVLADLFELIPRAVERAGKAATTWAALKSG